MLRCFYSFIFICDYTIVKLSLVNYNTTMPRTQEAIAGSESLQFRRDPSVSRQKPLIQYETTQKSPTAPMTISFEFFLQPAPESPFNADDCMVIEEG